MAHKEFRYERQVLRPGHTEYRWSVYERTYAIGELPVEEPAESPVEPAELPVTEPAQLDELSEPNAVDVPTVELQDTAWGRHASTRRNEPVADSREVPLSIDAGL